MSTRFQISPTPIDGLCIVQRKPLGDQRGYLERMYCNHELQTIVRGKHIIQINHTLTTRVGAVRGLHFQQPPHAEIKLVSCLRGQVFDVAVDLRRSSPTFLKWHAELLSADNHKTMVIPEGFAHGFQTLAEGSELLYFHTAAYHADSEAGLNVADPLLSIQWPLPVKDLSDRDRAHPFLTPGFQGIAI